jgi:uncharacterized protein YceH (UPF0502 family)
MTYEEIQEMIADAIHELKADLGSQIEELQTDVQELERRLDE